MICKINAVSQANMIKLLMDGAYTTKQLAEETGLHYMTVLEYLRELKKVKAVYVYSWEKDTKGAETIRVYALGDQKDAKPTRLTAKQRSARYRAKVRARKAVNIFSEFSAAGSAPPLTTTTEEGDLCVQP